MNYRAISGSRDSAQPPFQPPCAVLFSDQDYTANKTLKEFAYPLLNFSVLLSHLSRPLLYIITQSLGLRNS